MHTHRHTERERDRHNTTHTTYTYEHDLSKSFIKSKFLRISDGNVDICSIKLSKYVSLELSCPVDIFKLPVILLRKDMTDVMIDDFIR